MYENFVAADSQAGQRLIRQYMGMRTDFDIVIVGSGVGGGVLADTLASLAKEKNCASSSWKRARSSTPRTYATSAGS
jgi:hypothetical protein